MQYLSVAIIIILSITLIVIVYRNHKYKKTLAQFAGTSNQELDDKIEIILRFYSKLLGSQNEGLWVGKYRQRIFLDREPHEIAEQIFDNMYFYDCNEYFPKLLGLNSKADITNIDLKDVPNISRNRLTSEMEGIIREDKMGTIVVIESPFQDLDKFYVNSIYSIIVDNELIASVGLLRDFTKFSSNETELFDLKYAIEKTTEGICITDVNNIPLYINKAFTDITGYGFTDIADQHLNEILFNTTLGLPDSELKIRHVVENGGTWTGRTIIRAKDGTHKHLVANVTSIEYDNAPNRRVISVFSDVTHERKLEEALVQSQKLQAMGTLTGGVAHDFNNVLAIILGNVDYLLGNFDSIDKDDLKDSLEIINRSAKQGEAQTRRLLAFSRKTDTRIKSVYLDKWLSEVKPIYNQVISKNVKLRMKLDAYDAVCGLDHSLFELAIMNLVKNASQAISGSGEIEIRTSIVKYDDIEDVARKYLDNEEYALIEVEDNGSGMPQDTVDRIFEPFYTTKEEGKGTGLGLSMVYGIVDEHNGKIFVKSVVDEGTVFSIYVPLLESTYIDEESENFVTSMHASDIHTILIDDDKNFGHIMQKLFGSKNLKFNYGQTLDECTSILENVQAKNIVLVLSTDSSKSQDSQKIKELRKAYPDLKCIVIGTCNNSVVVSKVSLACDGTLCKPFNFNVLVSKISELINQEMKI